MSHTGKKKGKREACFKICCKKIMSKNNENEKNLYTL